MTLPQREFVDCFSLPNSYSFCANDTFRSSITSLYAMFFFASDRHFSSSSSSSSASCTLPPPHLYLTPPSFPTHTLVSYLRGCLWIVSVYNFIICRVFLRLCQTFFLIIILLIQRVSCTLEKKCNYTTTSL